MRSHDVFAKRQPLLLAVTFAVQTKTFAPNWWLRGIADAIGWAQNVVI